MSLIEKLLTRRSIIGFIIIVVLLVSQQQIYGMEIPSKDTKKEVPVLLYHHLDNGKIGADTIVTRQKFEEDMKYLKENEYTALLPQDLLDIKSGKSKMPEKPIMITFDDGYESNYTMAYPLLVKYEMKATIFVITVAMNKKVTGQISKLSWDQMKEMYESGVVDIQSHGYNLHNSDTTIPYSRLAARGIERRPIETNYMYNIRMEADTRESIELIEKNVGNKVFAFAYPYGLFDEWCVEPFERAGITLGFVLGGKKADLNANMLTLNRLNVEMDGDLDEIIKGYGIERDVYGKLN